MADRKNTFLLKRSNVSGNIPSAGQIVLGELALNTADVILYASGTTSNSILPIGWDRIYRTGDTMTGPLITPTISATTYLNLPTDIRLTGGTYNSGTATFTNNTGGTFSVTGFSTSSSGAYLPLSGGTVSGDTVFLSGLTANTLQLSANQINSLTFNSSNYGIGLDGNGFITYSTPEINGVITGHRIGRYDGATFREIAKFQSNQSDHNIFSMSSINGQTLPVVNIADHNGNTAFAMYGQSRQVIIGSFTPDASAALQVDSSTRGFLPPRLTSTERTTIASPATGLTVYDTVIDALFVNTTSGWLQLGASNPFTGGTVTGATNFTGGLSANTISATTITGNSLNISTTPSNDNALTQVLVRDSDGTIKYRTAASLAGTGSTGASVTAFTYNNLNTLTISDSEGDTFSTTINQMSGLTVNGSLSATTIYGDGSNITGMTGSFGITVDGSGSVLTSGVKGYVVMPYNATITGWDIIGNTSGTCEFDVWKSASPTIPSISDTITGTEKPTLNGQQINSDNTLTTWTTSLSINDVVAFNVVSATTVSRVNLIIKVIKK